MGERIEDPNQSVLILSGQMLKTACLIATVIMYLAISALILTAPLLISQFSHLTMMTYLIFLISGLTVVTCVLAMSPNFAVKGNLY